MATDVGICNSGLIKIGASRIVSFSDNTKEAIVANEQYAKMRDAVLESHPWNFAKTRVSLAALITGPSFGYKNSFQLPSDFLFAIETGYPETIYRIEGQALVSDESTIDLLYIRRVTDPALFSPLFAEALACRMGVEFSYAISNNASMAQTMMAAYKAQLAEARSRNGQGAGTPTTLDASQWINSRY